MKLPVNKSLKLITKAREEETKEYYYRFWLVRYPLYDKSSYETFDEFYDKVRPKNIVYDTRTKEEIMKEILEVEQSFEKGVKTY